MDAGLIARDLDSFAQALVRQLVKQHRLTWKSYQIEDAAQDLFLAGWQEYQQCHDVGLAKNRMNSRKINLLRDYGTELKHEPRPESSFSTSYDEDGNEQKLLDARESKRGSPQEEPEFTDWVANLPASKARICILKLMGGTTQEIADELGCSVRTIQRELKGLKKEYDHERKEG